MKNLFQIFEDAVDNGIDASDAAHSFAEYAKGAYDKQFDLNQVQVELLVMAWRLSATLEGSNDYYHYIKNPLSAISVE